MALLEREVLDANEIQMLIEGKELPAKVNPKPAAGQGRCAAGAEAGTGPAARGRAGAPGTGVKQLLAPSKSGRAA